VPWVKGVGQRGFNEDDLPKDDQKRELYEIGKELFSEMDYVEIGMDHFALKTDTLYKATQEKTIHRNFMGYTANKTQLMIGLGMSAISDSWYGFAQNVKTVKEYQKIVGEGEIPVFRGHVLSEEDLIIRKHILNIMCHFSTSWDDEYLQIENVEGHIEKLQEMIDDGLVFIEGNGLSVPEKARPYVRNICMAFDKRLHRNKPETKLFSMTI
jgi:oxygen-independent coproporphyrinogen-3 oxidase